MQRANTKPHHSCFGMKTGAPRVQRHPHTWVATVNCCVLLGACVASAAAGGTSAIHSADKSHPIGENVLNEASQVIKRNSGVSCLLAQASGPHLPTRALLALERTNGHSLTLWLLIDRSIRMEGPFLKSSAPCPAVQCPNRKWGAGTRIAPIPTISRRQGRSGAPRSGRCESAEPNVTNVRSHDQHHKGTCKAKHIGVTQVHRAASSRSP